MTDRRKNRKTVAPHERQLRRESAAVRPQPESRIREGRQDAADPHSRGRKGNVVTENDGPRQ